MGTLVLPAIDGKYNCHVVSVAKTSAEFVLRFLPGP